MPRIPDSDQPGGLLALVETVECDHCGTLADCFFAVNGDTVYDMYGALTKTHTCPTCGTNTEITYSGWTLYNEAG